MGLFERYLSAWVGLSIIAGIVLGYFFPDVMETFADFEFAHVNIVIAVFIWAMIFPMMVQIDFTAIKKVKEQPKGLWMTIFINWIIKPLTMAALAWLFFDFIFSAWIEPEKANEYIAGMILLGVAPCTAMVFVWSQLTKGDPNYTLVQVSVNDVIMIFAFAPIAGFLLGVSDVEVPWSTLVLSIVLYVLLPLFAGLVVRKLLLKRSEASLESFLEIVKPMASLGLIGTVILLFAFQSNTILESPLVIVLIAIPLLIQSYGIFFVAYGFSKYLKLPKDIAAPACLIGTSNFFEMAVAVAISLFGLHSGAALATVVGVLVEVPVMLSLVAFANSRFFKLSANQVK